MKVGPFLFWVMAVPFLVLCLPNGVVSTNSASAVSAESSVTSPLIASSKKNTIVLGRISNDPHKSHARLKRLADYLARKLAPHGITKGEAVVAKNNEDMLRYLRNGRVDFLSETVMTAIYLEKQTRAEILLHEWKKKVGWYWTIIFKHRKSKINSLNDLRGKKIVFEDPGSTTGFLLPLAILLKNKIPVIRLKNYRDAVPPGKVGYVFAYDELNITSWVERMFVDAGAFSNRDWLGKGRSPESMKQNLEILYKSKPMVRSLFIARHNIQPNIKSAVIKLMLNMHKNEDGRSVLKKYYKVKKYDRIKGAAKTSLEEARKLHSLVYEHIN